MTQRRQSFLSGAAVLAGAVAVTKLLGALYKIPLGNLLDSRGMAHFYAAYNVYNLLLMLSTAGLPLAASRLVARSCALGQTRQARRVFHTALLLLGVTGLVFSGVIPYFSFSSAAFCPASSRSFAAKTLPSNNLAVIQKRSFPRRKIYNPAVTYCTGCTSSLRHQSCSISRAAAHPAACR